MYLVSFFALLALFHVNDALVTSPPRFNCNIGGNQNQCGKLCCLAVPNHPGPLGICNFCPQQTTPPSTTPAPPTVNKPKPPPVVNKPKPATKPPTTKPFTVTFGGSGSLCNDQIKCNAGLCCLPDTKGNFNTCQNCNFINGVSFGFKGSFCNAEKKCNPGLCCLPNTNAPIETCQIC